MKKILLAALAAALIVFVMAQAEPADFEASLEDMSIQELYDLEDRVVLALRDTFIREATESDGGETIGTYVVNPKTGKFHFPWCYSALQIGERRRFETCAPSELTAQGYKPCGQCKPDTE